MLKKLFNDLLQFCRSNDNWMPGYDCTPLASFMDTAMTTKPYMNKWETQTAYELLFNIIHNNKLEIKKGITSALCSKMLDDFKKLLYLNSKKHYIILPLINCEIENILEFDRFLIIPGHLSRTEKLELLSSKLGKSYTETEWLASHTEKSRSRDFYKLPLYCIRVIHQNSWIYDNVRQIALWNLAFLRALYFGYNRRKRERLFGLFNNKYSNNHILILAKHNANCNHQPLWFNTDCSFSLDWLSKRIMQKKLLHLNNHLLFTNTFDRLKHRHSRAFKFFNKSINSFKSGEPFEGIGLSVLLLMISAESLLLHNVGEKRIRLAASLTDFGCHKNLSKTKLYNAINDCYRWRSDFVHSGNDTFLDYDENLEPGQTHGKIILLRSAVARTLVEFPENYRFIRKRVYQRNGGKQKASKSATETEWFKYLDDRWSRYFVK